MKDRIPDLERKEVSFEDLDKELRAMNAYSTGNNLGKYYVNLCKDRSVENCGICSLNNVCSKVLSDNSLKDLKP